MSDAQPAWIPARQTGRLLGQSTAAVAWSSSLSDPQNVPTALHSRDQHNAVQGFDLTAGTQELERNLDPPEAVPKRMYHSQRIRQLQEQASELARSLESLTVDNRRVRERQRMVELVLAVQARIQERAQEVCRGETSTLVYRVLGVSAEEVRSATPSWMRERCGGIAKDITRLHGSGRGLLVAHPSLLGPPDALEPRPVQEDLRTCLLPPTDPLVEFQPQTDEEADQKRDLIAMVELAHRLIIVLRHVLLMRPESLVGVSANQLHIVAHSSWDDVRNCLLNELKAEGGGARPGGPLLAPETHWLRLVMSLALSDAQILQAAVLVDILRTAQAAGAQRRSALLRNLSSPTRPAPTSKGPDDLAWEQRVAAQLDATLTQDRLHLLLADELLMLHVLTPLQAALVIVYAEPYVVDALAILHHAATLCTPEFLARLAATRSAAGR